MQKAAVGEGGARGRVVHAVTDSAQVRAHASARSIAKITRDEVGVRGDERDVPASV